MGCYDQLNDLLLLAATLLLAVLAIWRLWELLGPSRDSYVIHNQVRVRAFDGLYYRIHAAHASEAEEARGPRT